MLHDLQVGLWGAETGDEMGSGETYDGDGIGEELSCMRDSREACASAFAICIGGAHHIARLRRGQTKVFTGLTNTPYATTM